MKLTKDQQKLDILREKIKLNKELDRLTSVRNAARLFKPELTKHIENQIDMVTSKLAVLNFAEEYMNVDIDNV